MPESTNILHFEHLEYRFRIKIDSYTQKNNPQAIRLS